MSLKITTRQVGDVVILDASGRITLGEGASHFRDALRDLQAKGNNRLLLNLGDVSYLDSSGLGELVSAYNAVQGGGGEMKLLHLSKRVHDLLQITKLITVFEVFDDEALALRSF